MERGSLRCALLLLLGLASLTAGAQQEGGLRGDFRREGERMHDACLPFSFRLLPGCAYELVSDHPLHIALGSIAPKNGFGTGLAFVGEREPNNDWRFSWDVDAVASNNLSWRAGAYLQFIHSHVKLPTPVPAPSGPHPKPTTKRKPPKLAVQQFTVYSLYAQRISLNRLFYFGEGPGSVLAGQSVLGETQTIVGASVIKPLNKFNLSLFGEVNGRFVSLRGNHAESQPSIEQIYNEATAPGLATQPAFAQLGEGIRFNPAFLHHHVQLNYLGSFQQFFAPSNSRYSFLRWTADLGHLFPIYGQTRSGPIASQGPDHCAPAGTDTCPKISTSVNREGAIGLRLLLSESLTSASSVVPFYFQPTLGGSDINGTPALSSYQDYRFRGPNILLLRESFEHSIWGPFGLNFMADQGKVTLTRGDIGFSHLKHSFAAGLTIRAGALPEISLLYAWGGNEGHHTIVNVNPVLLNSSYRPPLY